MVFSSPAFLYYFLPITLAVYFLVPAIKGSQRLKNLALLIASLVFYAWGEPVFVLLMIGQCIAAWGFGLLIQRYPGGRAARVLMFASVLISLSGLLYFKYANFFISNINNLTGAGIGFVGYVMPIGISFYTFQIISYTVDLYNAKITAQRDLVNFSMYVTSFPQLIAGPIVRYTDIMRDINHRAHNLPRFANGARRFIIGLGKKVLLANIFGQLVEIYKVSGNESVLFVWLYIIAFALQIYFDFSGYSDMAIGLGNIVGFKFPENFNYPYIAESVTEFWKRWHMTLSAWFRDYVYIPLGGSRSGPIKHIVSLLFVWMLTGFWHGAGWNFILWGGYFGAILLFERYVIARAADRLPRFLRHIYTLLIVIVSWVFFDAASFNEAFSRIGRMFGAGAYAYADMEGFYYLRSYAIPLLVGIVAATPLAKRIAEKLESRKTLATVLEPAALAAILILSTAAIVNGSYNPFIYFRF